MAALPYLHETLKPVVDAIYNEKKAIELDPDQLKNIKYDALYQHSSLSSSVDQGQGQ